MSEDEVMTEPDDSAFALAKGQADALMVRIIEAHPRRPIETCQQDLRALVDFALRVGFEAGKADVL